MCPETINTQYIYYVWDKLRENTAFLLINLINVLETD